MCVVPCGEHSSQRITSRYQPKWALRLYLRCGQFSWCQPHEQGESRKQITTQNHQKRLLSPDLFWMSQDIAGGAQTRIYMSTLLWDASVGIGDSSHESAIFVAHASSICVEVRVVVEERLPVEPVTATVGVFNSTYS